MGGPVQRRGQLGGRAAALTRPDVPPEHVELHGVIGGGSGDRGCKALLGEVGTAAAFVEVEQCGTVTRRPADSGAGHWWCVATTTSH
jgi:hypothetical protein